MRGVRGFFYDRASASVCPRITTSPLEAIRNAAYPAAVENPFMPSADATGARSTTLLRPCRGLGSRRALVRLYGH